MVGKTLGDIGKAQENFFWSDKGAKKDIMNVKTISVLVLKIDYHIFEWMKVEMISCTIYMIMDDQCLITNYLLNSLLTYDLNILIFWPYVNWSSRAAQSLSMLNW